jgi:glycosyltransferase involved in cell wall biosynthesis
MKVALVSHVATIGGAELVLLELARGLASRGVTVDAILPGPGSLGPRLEAVGAQTWALAYEWWVAPSWSWAGSVRRAYHNVATVRSAMSLLRRLGADVVITNTLTIPAAAVAAKALGIPHVWYLHEFGKKDHGLEFDLGWKNSVRLIDWLSARVIVNSHALFDEFSGSIPVHKLRVVYCAADVSPGPDDNPCPPDRPFRVVLVGNMTPAKGQEDAIRAVGLLRKRGREVRLALVGHCSTQHQLHLRELAVGVRAENAVDFIAFTEAPDRHFMQSHVALMCSRSEAFGRVTVEAMKLGLPVIGANSGGTRELIQDGWNGLLYPTGDAAQLAERIDRLYDDQALRARLGRNGKEWAERTFSLTRHTDAVLRVLAEVVPHPGP